MGNVFQSFQNNINQKSLQQTPTSKFKHFKTREQKKKLLDVKISVWNLTTATKQFCLNLIPRMHNFTGTWKKSVVVFTLIF